MKYRIEKDSIGEINVPVDRLWGAQTQRSLQNFAIGTEKMPTEVIQALALPFKKASKLLGPMTSYLGKPVRLIT